MSVPLAEPGEAPLVSFPKMTEHLSHPCKAMNDRQRIKSRLTIARGIARARAGSPIPSCNTTIGIVVAQ
jgi:hypothetical protein